MQIIGAPLKAARYSLVYTPWRDVVDCGAHGLTRVCEKENADLS